MRVPTNHTAQRTFDGIEARQAAQDRIQGQLGTGLRITRPGDDPVAAAQAELARSRLARLSQDQRATQLAGSLMSRAEGALAQGVNILQSVREALVAAGDGAYSLSDRQSLALQLRSARDAMLDLANSQDGAGSHIFSGQGIAASPLGGTPLAWDAPAGVQRIGEDGRYAATVDGRAAFMALPQGNGVFTTASSVTNTGSGWIDTGSVSDPAQLTGHALRIDIGGAAGALTYTVTDLTLGTAIASNLAMPADGRIDVAGQRVQIGGTPATGDAFQLAPAARQSVFQTLDEAIATLESPLSNAAYAERLQRSQVSLDGALNGLIDLRSHVGEELRRIDDAAQSGELQTLTVAGRRSDLQDLDFARAISELQTNQAGLEAAIKAYATIGRTSLFQLLG